MSGFLRKQVQLLLGHSWYAVLYTMLLAMLPYAAWLSAAAVAMVTLRKGSREGFVLLVAGISAHCMLSLMSLPLVAAAVGAILTFLPCYLAACMLRWIASWQVVAGVLFLQALMVFFSLHLFFPDFAMAQYAYIQSAIQNLRVDDGLIKLFSAEHGTKSLLMANYILGIQAVGVICSAVLSLMLARSLQSQLYYPGGFKREMLNFRGEKIALLLFVAMLFSANQGNLVAINILPMLVFYFLLAGLSLAYNLLATKKMLATLLLLVVPLALLPLVALPVYVLAGSLDCLFNFRLYLPNRAGKSV